jgi:GT2 family glycosyltransferase
MLFDRVGGFDESLPVCEDYDLWLRIAVDHFVSLIPQALVVKRGGHADQLSHSMWGMDRYRVVALQKLLRSGLGGARRTATLDMLRRKLIILAQGSRKRGKQQEAAAYDKMIGEFLEESVDVGDSNTGLRGGQRVPLANRDAVA